MKRSALSIAIVAALVLIGSRPAHAQTEITMIAPGSGDAMPPTSKNRNPDCVVCGSTALAAKSEDSISSISFLLMAPFTLWGSGIGLGREKVRRGADHFVNESIIPWGAGMAVRLSVADAVKIVDGAAAVVVKLGETIGNGDFAPEL